MLLIIYISSMQHCLSIAPRCARRLFPSINIWTPTVKLLTCSQRNAAAAAACIVHHIHVNVFVFLSLCAPLFNLYLPGYTDNCVDKRITLAWFLISWRCHDCEHWQFKDFKGCYKTSSKNFKYYKLYYRQWRGFVKLSINLIQ